MRSRPRIALVITISLLIGLAGAADASARKKLVALTFDGGPSGYTPKIDRILQRKHVQASFFWVGSRIEGRGKVVRRVARQGHEIANHSWFHDDLTGLPVDEVRRQLARTNRRLSRLTGERPRLFRPPYGAVNEDVRRIAADLGMRTVLWDADSLDWIGPGCDRIAANVRERVRHRSIVLLHDGGGNRSQTVCALPRVIRDLRSRGYRFVTVSKLLRKRPSRAAMNSAHRSGLYLGRQARERPPETPEEVATCRRSSRTCGSTPRPRRPPTSTSPSSRTGGSRTSPTTPRPGLVRRGW